MFSFLLYIAMAKILYDLPDCFSPGRRKNSKTYGMNFIMGKQACFPAIQYLLQNFYMVAYVTKSCAWSRARVRIVLPACSVKVLPGRPVPRIFSTYC